MRRTSVSSAPLNPQSTSSPMKNVCPPQSTGLRTSQAIQAAAWSSTGAPVGPSWYGNPLRVRASGSCSTGLVNLRMMALSSRATVLSVNDPPSAMS